MPGSRLGFFLLRKRRHGDSLTWAVNMPTLAGAPRESPGRRPRHPDGGQHRLHALHWGDHSTELVTQQKLAMGVSQAGMSKSQEFGRTKSLFISGQVTVQMEGGVGVRSGGIRRTSRCCSVRGATVR